MREVFGTQPHRGPEDEPLIIPFQNFKGGVGKSTLAIHAAQYLAMRGYRVLLIDADAQASTTMMFGYIPDQEIDMADSLYPVVLKGDAEIGRASCRERVCKYVEIRGVAVPLKKKKK